MENVYHVGLDVHKETVEMSVFYNWNQEPEFEKRMNNDQGKIISQLKKLQKNGRVAVCYEAGCMGFVLKRALDEAGIDCHVVSPGKLPRKPTDKIKTDRRDARNLAKLHRAGETEAIYIPTDEDEATRDYIRARDDIKLDLKRAKQQLLKFLLRYGYRYETNRYWTGKHRKWMKGITFLHLMHKETFETYYTRILELEERLVFMEARITEIAQTERYRESVNHLRCFKGIDYLIALALVCEVGDFRRFPDAGSFMAYLGLVPREHSSGEKRRQGGITKSGNGHIRRLLIESSWHYRYQSPPGKRLTSRRVGQNIEVIAYADKGMRRLQKKFSKLLFKGKSKNATVTAVARELAGFIWGVMNNKIAA
jgi:transposase